MDFTPGRPLPTEFAVTQERTLYHAPRMTGVMGTMTRDGGTWQWRQLRGDGPDAYGYGGWNDLQTWLKRSAPLA